MIDPANGFNLKVAAYNSSDFTMPVAQWIVADFDGKYTFTLTNRETGKDLVLKLQPNGAEGGYEVVSAKYDGNNASIVAGVTTTTSMQNTSVKFNSIATTRTDGYVVFNETQEEEGIKLTFNGKDDLFGNKALYAIVAGNSMATVSSLDNGEVEIVLYPERVKGDKNHSNKALREVADYVLSTNAYAYVNNNNAVVRVADKDTLVVPTYILRLSEQKSDNAAYLNASYAGGAKANAAEFAVVKNAAGGYSLVTVKNTVDGISTLKSATYRV